MAMGDRLPSVTSSAERCDGVALGGPRPTQATRPPAASLIGASGSDLDDRRHFSEVNDAVGSASRRSGSDAAVPAKAVKVFVAEGSSGSRALNSTLSRDSPSAQVAPCKETRDGASGAVSSGSSLACAPLLSVGNSNSSYTMRGTRSAPAMTPKGSGHMVNGKDIGQQSPSSRAARTSRVYRGSIDAPTSCSESRRHLNSSGCHISCFPVQTELAHRSTDLVAATDGDAAEGGFAQGQLGGTAAITFMSSSSTMSHRNSLVPPDANANNTAATLLIPPSPADTGARAPLLMPHDPSGRSLTDSHAPVHRGSTATQLSSHIAEGQPAHLSATGVGNQGGGGGGVAQLFSVSGVALSPASFARDTSAVSSTSADSSPGATKHSLTVGPFTLIQPTPGSSPPFFADATTVVNTAPSTPSSVTESTLIAPPSMTVTELSSDKGSGAAAAMPSHSSSVGRPTPRSAVAAPHRMLPQRFAPSLSDLPSTTRSAGTVISTRTATDNFEKASKEALATGLATTSASPTVRPHCSSMLSLLSVAAGVAATNTAAEHRSGSAPLESVPSTAEAAAVALATVASATGQHMSASRHTRGAPTAPGLLLRTSASAATAAASSAGVSAGAVAKAVEEHHRDDLSAHNNFTLAEDVVGDARAAAVDVFTGAGRAAQHAAQPRKRGNSSSSARGRSTGGSSSHSRSRIPRTVRTSSGPTTPASVAAAGSASYLSVVSMMQLPARPPTAYLSAEEKRAPRRHHRRHSRQPQHVHRRTSPHTVQGDRCDGAVRSRHTSLATVTASSNGDRYHMSAAAYSSTNDALATSSQRSVMDDGDESYQRPHSAKMSALSAVARLVARLRRTFVGANPSMTTSSAGADISGDGSAADDPGSDTQLRTRGATEVAALSASSMVGATLRSDARKAMSDADESISTSARLLAWDGTRVGPYMCSSSLVNRCRLSGPRATPHTTTPVPDVATVATATASPWQLSHLSSMSLSQPSSVLVQMPVPADEGCVVCGGGGTGANARLLESELVGLLSARDKERPLAVPSLPVGWPLQEQCAACTLGSSRSLSQTAGRPEVVETIVSDMNALAAHCNCTRVQNTSAGARPLAPASKVALPPSAESKDHRARSSLRLCTTSSACSDAEHRRQSLRSTCESASMPNVPSLRGSSAATALCMQQQLHGNSSRSAREPRSTFLRSLGAEMRRRASAVLRRRCNVYSSGVGIGSGKNRIGAVGSPTPLRQTQAGGGALHMSATRNSMETRSAESLYSRQGRHVCSVSSSGVGVTVAKGAATPALLGADSDAVLWDGSGTPHDSALQAAPVAPLFHSVLGSDTDNYGGDGPHTLEAVSSLFRTSERPVWHCGSSASAYSDGRCFPRYEWASRTTTASDSLALPPDRPLCGDPHTIAPLPSLLSAAQTMFDLCAPLTTPPVLFSAASAASTVGCESATTGTAKRSTAPRMSHAPSCSSNSDAALQGAPNSVTKQTAVARRCALRAAPLSTRIFVSTLAEPTARPPDAAGGRDAMSLALTTPGVLACPNCTTTASMLRPRSGRLRRWTSTLRAMDRTVASLTATASSSSLSPCPPRRPHSTRAAATVTFPSILFAPTHASTPASAAGSAPPPAPGPRMLGRGSTRSTPTDYRTGFSGDSTEHEQLHTGKHDQHPHDPFHSAAAALLPVQPSSPLRPAAARRQLSGHYGNDAATITPMSTNGDTAATPESSGRRTVLVSDAAQASSQHKSLEPSTLCFTPTVPAATAKVSYVKGGDSRRSSTGRSPPHPLAVRGRRLASNDEAESAVAAHGKLLLGVSGTPSTPAPLLTSVSAISSTLCASTPCSVSSTDLSGGGGDFRRGAAGHPRAAGHKRAASGALQSSSAALFSLQRLHTGYNGNHSLASDSVHPQHTGSFRGAKLKIATETTSQEVELACSVSCLVGSTVLGHRDSGSSAGRGAGAARRAAVLTVTGSSSGALGSEDYADDSANASASTPLQAAAATSGATYLPPLLSCDAAPALLHLSRPLLFRHQCTESLPSGGVPALMLDNDEPGSQLRPTSQHQIDTRVQWPGGLYGAAVRGSSPRQQQQRDSAISVLTPPAASARVSRSPLCAGAPSAIPSPTTAAALFCGVRGVAGTAMPSGAHTVQRDGDGGAGDASSRSSIQTSHSGRDVSLPIGDLRGSLAEVERPPANVPLSRYSFSLSPRASHSLLLSGAEYGLPAPLPLCDASGSGAGGSFFGGPSLRTSSELPSDTIASFLYFPPELRRGPHWRHLKQHLGDPNRSSSPSPMMVAPQHSGPPSASRCSLLLPKTTSTLSSSLAVLAATPRAGSGTPISTRPSSPRLSGERPIPPTSTTGRWRVSDDLVVDSAEERCSSHSCQVNGRYKTLSCQLTCTRPLRDDANELSLVSAAHNVTVATLMSESPSVNNASDSAVTRRCSSTRVSDGLPAAVAGTSASMPPSVGDSTRLRLQSSVELLPSRDSDTGTHSGFASRDAAGAAAWRLSQNGCWRDAVHGIQGHQACGDDEEREMVYSFGEFHHLQGQDRDSGLQ
ncbi:hypothetical protein CUR178_07520 [Leishmania enriettii]|uniref:Uncharacterized protein n=1 Tax=Leishmania enriettii TaxID=5663 RepID=A0A836H2Y6_LEIEN|nr:hypothetical protein CUR178_07520 [Leishmania enriettii]